MEAVAKSRNWIEVASGLNVAEKWKYTRRLEEEIAPQTYMVGSFSPRYVGGPRLLTEHLLTEDDEQWAKPTLEALREHMPDNFKSMEVDIEGCAELYVVPLFNAALEITDEMLAATKQLLFPHDKDEYAAAKNSMGITLSENGTQRYSISGSRLFFWNVCPLLVTQGGGIVCGCQDGRVGAECGHENYVRYLKHQLLRDEFAPMRSLTQSKTKRNLACLNRGRPPGLPTNSARWTMNDVRDAAKARQAKREAKKDASDTQRKCCLRKAFSSPERESQERATKKARVERQQRATTMFDISRGLENVDDVPNVYKALHLCKDTRIVYEEARNSEYRIGLKVQNIKKTSTSAGAKVVAKALLAQWSAEKIADTVVC